jgi:hypothetical protein
MAVVVETLAGGVGFCSGLPVVPHAAKNSTINKQPMELNT